MLLFTEPGALVHLFLKAMHTKGLTDLVNSYCQLLVSQKNFHKLIFSFCKFYINEFYLNTSGFLRQDYINSWYLGVHEQTIGITLYDRQ